MTKKTCKECRHFTPYSDSDPDGRCGEGCGTYCTHTRGEETACALFESMKNEKTTIIKKMRIELILACVFYAIVIYHNVAPRAWTWLDERQVNNVALAGSVWCAFLLFGIWKSKRKEREK